MTKEHAVPAANTGLPEDEDDLTTDRGRVAVWCPWFNLQVPKLRYRIGLLWNDASAAWFKEAGASIDWIVSGDPRGMATAFRGAQLQHRRAARAVVALGPVEKRVIVTARRASVDLNLDLDEILAIAQAEIDQHRAEAAASTGAAA